MHNNARPISISICVGAASLFIGFLWGHRRRQRYQKIHAYAPTVTFTELKNNEFFLRCLGENFKLKRKGIRGTMDAEGSFARMALTLEGNGNQAVVLLGSRFVESELRLRAKQEEFKELVEYQKERSFSTLLIKPYLIKLFIKQKLSSIQAATGSEKRYLPAFPGDTSHWEIRNITVVIRPQPKWFWRLRRILLRFLLGKEELAQRDRQETVMFSVCGVPLEHPGMEMYLNPLNVDVTSQSKHNIRPVLFLAFFMLMLYSRKRYRAWDKVERSTKDAADDHVIALLQTLPPFRGLQAKWRITKLLGNRSPLYMNAKALIEPLNPTNSSSINPRTLNFIASRSNINDKFTIHSWTLK